MPRKPTVRSTPARSRHWEGVYRTRGEDELSWHQKFPAVSLRLIRQLAPHGTRILDAGGGSSLLGCELARGGYSDITVVDLSARALARGRRRGGLACASVHRVRADLLDHPKLGRFGVWHDRAVFHFLTSRRDRERYVTLLDRSLEPGGLAVIATFAHDGPTTCSGLPVARYSAARLAEEFAPAFRKVRSLREVHRTPWGTRQAFTYVVLGRRRDTAAKR